MKTMKLSWLAPLALAFAAGSAGAADISNISGQSCAGTGTWHFVNNQTTGAPAGVLTATWSSGNSCTVSPSKVNQYVQHFYCTASGALLSASTNLPGRLVLSDYVCNECNDEFETCE